MKSALLAQNDNLAIENLKQKVGRSVFDLSHSTTFPIDVDGAILPICCIETVPSDSFQISCECLLRQLSPFQVPLMANFRLNTAWYWCDNRLGWKKWDRFMTGGRSGNEVYELPRVYNLEVYPIGEVPSEDNEVKSLVDKGMYYNENHFQISKSLHSYFGFKSNVTATFNPDYNKWNYDSGTLPDEDDLPLAFPFFDYQIICRDFYTNVDRLAQNPIPTARNDKPFSDWAYENLFPVDDDEFKLVDGIQKVCGFHSGDDPDNSDTFFGCYLDKVRYHNVRDDYFVSSKKAPMRGNAPSITAVSSGIKLPDGTTIQIVKKGDMHMLTGDVNNSNFVYVDSVSKSGNNVRIGSTTNTPAENGGSVTTEYNASYTNPATPGLILDTASVSAITGNINGDVSLQGTLTTEITTAELRLLSQLSVWQELNMLHEPYYNDFLNAHFEGVSVGESAVEKPIYIGGTSQHIAINEIMQTSQSSDSSPLGNQGAVAMSLANNYVGKYYCNNYGYLIGLAYIITDMYYNPAIPRWSSRRTKEDFYSPEFANLSMQAILNKEMFSSNSKEWNNTPWGYTGSFDELRTIPNRVAGDLLNDDYLDLKKWVIRRDFDNSNKPSMSTEFLSLNGNVDKTAWSVPTMPAFMLQCANYIKAVRPMPKVAIPKAL